MSNIKVGGKVFRDVEKMSLEQLQEVRTAIIMRQQAIAKEGMKLRQTPNHGTAARIAQMDTEFKGLEQRLNTVDRLAKPMAKKETTDKLMAMPTPVLADVVENVVANPEGKLIVQGRTQGKTVPVDQIPGFAESLTTQ